MVIHAVKCRECGVTRNGYKQDGELRPARDECSKCGAMSYTVPADN
jgi:hypothetical protein